MNQLEKLIFSTEWRITHGSREPKSPWTCGETEWGQPSISDPTPSFSIIHDLVHQLSGRANESVELRKKIDELSRRVDKHEQVLREFFGSIHLPEPGSFEEWLSSDQLVASYRGKHVAFVAGQGVIAFSDSLDEVIDIVQRTNKLESVTVGFVPTVAM